MLKRVRKGHFHFSEDTTPEWYETEMVQAAWGLPCQLMVPPSALDDLSRATILAFSGTSFEQRRAPVKMVSAMGRIVRQTITTGYEVCRAC